MPHSKQSMAAVKDQKPPPSALPMGSAPLWTVRELAVFLQISPSTLYRMVDRGEIPAVRMGSTGRTVRFRREAIEVWLQTHEHENRLLAKS